MKVLITGANGFVGAALCRYFYKQGYEVVATGRQAKPHPNLLKHATYIQWDITGVKYLGADICIHAAGLASDTASYEELYLNNVAGTGNVLESVKHCSYFIFISSSSVYEFEDLPAKESSASLNNKLSPYGKTKLMAEDLVSNNIPENQQRLILRPRAIYGIGDRILLPNLLKLNKGNWVIGAMGDSVETSATHIDNLCLAVGLFLKQENKPPLQIFNVADNQAYNFMSITLKILSAVAGRNLKFINIPYFALKTAGQLLSALHLSKSMGPVALKALTQNSVLDLTAIKQGLGYKPTRDFYSTYALIGEWVRKLGGKKAYLECLDAAPWLIED